MASQASTTSFIVGAPIAVKGLNAFFMKKKRGINGVQIVQVKTSTGADYRIDNAKTRVWVFPKGDYSQKVSLTDLTDNNDMLKTVRALEAGVKKLRLPGKFKSTVQESKKHQGLFNITAKFGSSYTHFDSDKLISDIKVNAATIGKVLLNPVVYSNGKGHGLSLQLMCSLELEQEKENAAPAPIVECPW